MNKDKDTKKAPAREAAHSKTDAQRKLGGQPESDKEAREAGVKSATSSSKSP